MKEDFWIKLAIGVGATLTVLLWIAIPTTIIWAIYRLVIYITS